MYWFSTRGGLPLPSPLSCWAISEDIFWLSQMGKGERLVVLAASLRGKDQGHY